ncbi:MAG: tRNA pseudouridine(38-40) synthase TruA [Prevotellaceae bacterium]|nr:tRNA pseudouridine(38-40) synthase TruA [Prevotellaceae bacterium]
MRYFIYLSYDGGAYHGWQIQPNAPSVQEVLQNALTTILRTPTEIVGAGRTDAGVNASTMVAHFDTDASVDTLPNRLNRLLPSDIAIHRILPVTDDAHARFSATSRTYHYYIALDKSPFHRHYAYRYPLPLDFDRMNEAAQHLFLYTDFTSFSKLHTDVKTNNCRIMHAQWQPTPDGLWQFTITADRFLRNMVRAIVGTLLEVGRGRLSIDDFCRIIEQKDRCAAGSSVPGNALFLADITYPQELFR